MVVSVDKDQICGDDGGVVCLRRKIVCLVDHPFEYGSARSYKVVIDVHRGSRGYYTSKESRGDDGGEEMMHEA